MKAVDLKHLKISFLGGGNMASAMISGLIHKGIDPQNLLAVDPLPTARNLLTEQFQIRTATDLSQAENFLQISQLVVLCVKPQQLLEALSQLKIILKDLSDPNILMLSIVAGVRLDDIANQLGHSKIVRAMPNTPALIQKGITGLFTNGSIVKEEAHIIEIVCEAIGNFIWVSKESQLDTVTAISGSGPAYIFMLIEHLMKSGIALGLTSEQAKLLAAHTVIGSGMLALDSPDSPQTLREKVTSKGGTTFAALEVLKSHAWGEALEEAVSAANHRAKEMGDNFNQ
jgi:pyrroline-5-carboxylate reductase